MVASLRIKLKTLRPSASHSHWPKLARLHLISQLIGISTKKMLWLQVLSAFARSRAEDIKGIAKTRVQAEWSLDSAKRRL